MIYHCCEPLRLEAVKRAGVLNGIEYLEVSDSEAPSPDLRQRTLYVRLLLPAAGVTAANLSISGGERVPTVAVEWVAPATALPPGEDPSLVANVDDPATMLLVRTAARGDFSTYTLAIATNGVAPAGFDPLLNTIEFSFKVECDSDFDCRVDHVCPPKAVVPPPIDYLAKDFSSLRRLMLDRISLLAPTWTERNPADVGVMLVEALAYVADELSYRQDAVATEAYLDTARLRTSLRRHARLVDYTVHEGCNSRAWVQVEVTGEGVDLPQGTQLLTTVPGVPQVIADQSTDHLQALAAGAETFETIEPAVLYGSHQELDFWAWGDDECCLPAGATAATLIGEHPALKPGDVLILAEIVGPATGNEADADPAKRVAVRLTEVVSTTDPSAGALDDPPTNTARDVTQIKWDELDALPFPLCITSRQVPGVAISRAWGNIVLADHGRTVAGEKLGRVPASMLDVAVPTPAHCDEPRERAVPARFRPELDAAPLTHAHASPWKRVAQGASSPGLEAELTGLAAGPLLTQWLSARSVKIDTTAATVRGGHGVWALTDGRDTVTLRLTAGTLSAYRQAPSAAMTRRRNVRDARPAITLAEDPAGASQTWNPQLDLLASDGDAREFVVEVEHDRRASIRFGDGIHGLRPDTGQDFAATYRVGNGAAGNVGAGSITHIVTSQTDLERCTNPLPATGGTEPEAADAIRRDAPEAFTVQQRAVTALDYATMTEKKPEVQRAAATFRWTGSWHTVFVTADRLGGGAIDAKFEKDVRRHLEPFRMAGYDLEVDQPQFVPLEVALRVCVHPDHFRPDVKEAVLQRLTSGIRPDGTKGFFHPDRLTFGQPVYLSAIVAEVQRVPGVTSVTVETFQRHRDASTDATDTGLLTMGRLEIARLDNDPNFPERGALTLTMEGGK